MTLSLSGDYANIRRFIHQLETAPEFLVLESVIVTQTQEGERRLNVTARGRDVLPGRGQWKLSHPPRRRAGSAPLLLVLLGVVVAAFLLM